MNLLQRSLLTFVAIGLVACGSSFLLTQANLDKIHEDMSPSEVQTILGAPTSSDTQPIPIIGGTTTTYTYRDQNSEVTIVFKNDKMKAKSGSFAH